LHLGSHGNGRHFGFVQPPTAATHTTVDIPTNGKMIFVNNDYISQRLITLNEDGTLDNEITCLPSNSFDVTYLDDTTVAVSTYSGIEIININSAKTERRIETSKMDVV
jgi:hypothetical protein